MNPFLLQPVPTGDATARYERLSHGGATWYDLMPTPANGTDGGTPGFWPNFDGVSWATIGKPAKLDFANAFTICGWAFQSADPPTQGNEFVISRDGATRNVIYLQSDNGNRITFFGWTPAFNSAQGPVTTDAGGGGAVAWGADDWEFGRPQNGLALDYFTGQIDTGRFYNRALSPDEILRDYHAGKPAHP